MRRQTFECDRCHHEAVSELGRPPGWFAGTLQVATGSPDGQRGLGAAEFHLCPACRVSFVPPDPSFAIGGREMNAMAAHIVTRWLRTDER